MTRRLEVVEIFTVDALETATWRGIDITAVWAVQFDSVMTRDIRPSAWYDMSSVAKHPRACAEDSLFIFFHLKEKQLVR